MLVGAVIARLCGRRLYPVWIGLALVAAAVFAVLVVLGPRLGDPDKVVEAGMGEPGVMEAGVMESAVGAGQATFASGSPAARS